MTYFEFLIVFLIIPIIILVGVAAWDRSRGRELPAALNAWPPAAAILLHVVVAVLYTTIWDNYLVATNVWWYDPRLVTGLVIAYVPIEEYTFFILQPILAGLWLMFLLRRIRLPNPQEGKQAGQQIASADGLRIRIGATVIAATVWLFAVGLLVSAWSPGIYLGLELVWALPPIALQLAFGADILWRYRRPVALTIIPLTLYLSAADTLAIGGGIWTINPTKSLTLFIGGELPVEEFIFFLLTNTLVTFGVTLVMAQSSHERIHQLTYRLRERFS